MMNCKIRGSLNKYENPKWPPPLGSLVLVDHPNYKDNLFVGTVHQYLPNTDGAIIVLLNNKHYNEVVLEHKNILPSGSTIGMLMLLPKVHGWKYVDINKFNKEFGKCFNTVIDQPKTQAELTIGSTYEDPSASKNAKCDGDDGVKDYSLLNEKGELQMEDLFKEKDINQELFKKDEKFIFLGDRIKTMLLSKIELNETIPKEESKNIVNKTTAIDRLINKKEDEINEGTKIIEWVKTNILNEKTKNTSYLSYSDIKIFDGLKYGIFAGYVHFSRKGIRVDDVINETNVPGLKYFRWQYGIPIDYDTLKYILFQSEFQQKIKKNIDEQKEAERIFSQEYLIALQPEPQYQIWSLKRLIMCWFADKELEKNIRKIKIIINQYRSRADNEFNQKYGCLPSIVIYPRYGKESARKVLLKILHYFALYQNIGWSCSKPSYFVKVNDLVWYTNGSIDLKQYFTKTLGSYDGKTSNKSFNKYFSEVLGSEKLLHPYKEDK